MTDRKHAAAGTALLQLVGLDRHHQAPLVVDLQIKDVPGTSNIASARAHQRTPEPHIQWFTVWAFVVGKPGRF